MARLARNLNLSINLDTHMVDYNTSDNSMNRTNEMIAGQAGTFVPQDDLRVSVTHDKRVQVGGNLNLNFPVTFELPDSVNAFKIPDIRNHVSAAKNKQLIVFTVVGCGGTGGYVIRDLIRFLYSLKMKGDLRNFEVHLIDADIVEEKNLIRQNFIPSDLGKHKATVMANRYGGTFGIPTTAHLIMLENRDTLTNIVTAVQTAYNQQSSNTLNIIIGCVDNHAARRVISSYAIEKGGTYWIDSGNERTSGQVACGFMGLVGAANALDIGVDMRNKSLFRLPFITDHFTEIRDPKNDLAGSDNTSCAERAMQEDQNIFINMTAAMNVLNFVRQVTLSEDIGVPYIEFGINGVTTPMYSTPENHTKIIKRINDARAK